jgi:hypothetical protein
MTPKNTDKTNERLHLDHGDLRNLDQALDDAIEHLQQLKDNENYSDDLDEIDTQIKIYTKLQTRLKDEAMHCASCGVRKTGLIIANGSRNLCETCFEAD